MLRVALAAFFGALLGSIAGLVILMALVSSTTVL